jgi:riboflavin kinase/FMN adenylyltransferase
MLSRLGLECGFAVSSVEEVTADGAPVSSTRIRRALERGAVVEANAMLGRSYELDGLVSRGDRLGHQIGVPTINLEAENELPPADGVYVTEIEIRSFGRRFASVTNIGRRPTLYEDYTTTIETYVLDFSADVYGEKVRVFVLARLREERKFPSMMDLKAQIQRDIAATREYFERRGAASAS